MSLPVPRRARFLVFISTSERKEHKLLITFEHFSMWLDEQKLLFFFYSGRLFSGSEGGPTFSSPKNRNGNLCPPKIPNLRRQADVSILARRVWPRSDSSWTHTNPPPWAVLGFWLWPITQSVRRLRMIRGWASHSGLWFQLPGQYISGTTGDNKVFSHWSTRTFTTQQLSERLSKRTAIIFCRPNMKPARRPMCDGRTGNNKANEIKCVFTR